MLCVQDSGSPDATGLERAILSSIANRQAPELSRIFLVFRLLGIRFRDQSVPTGGARSRDTDVFGIVRQAALDSRSFSSGPAIADLQMSAMKVRARVLRCKASREKQHGTIHRNGNSTTRLLVVQVHSRRANVAYTQTV